MHCSDELIQTALGHIASVHSQDPLLNRNLLSYATTNIREPLWDEDSMMNEVSAQDKESASVQKIKQKLNELRRLMRNEP